MPSCVVIVGAKTSIVSHKTLIAAGYDVIYTKGQCILAKGEQMWECVPKGSMFRVLVTDQPYTDVVRIEAIRRANRLRSKLVFDEMKTHQMRAHRPKNPLCGASDCWLQGWEGSED